MAKRKPSEQGIAVIFFETDLEKSIKQDESNYTPLQKQIFQNLSAPAQEKIRAGYGAAVGRLGSDERICEFNMEDHQFPQHAIENYAESCARLLLPEFLAFMENEENRRKLEEYMKRQEDDK